MRSSRRVLFLLVALLALAVLAVLWTAGVRRGGARRAASGVAQGGHEELALTQASGGERSAPSNGRRPERDQASVSPSAPAPLLSELKRELGTTPKATRIGLVGLVQDERARPIEGAEVWLRPLASGPQPERLVTRSEADGRLRGTMDAHFWMECRVLAPGRSGAALRLRQPASDTLDLGTLTLGPGGEMLGTVWDAEGRPAEGAVVRAYPEEWLPDPSDLSLFDRSFPPGLFQAEARSDAQGRFRLRGVPEGRWFVGAERGEEEHGLGPVLEVHVGLAPEVQVFLSAAADAHTWIRGRVLSPRREPLAGILVNGYAPRWVGGTTSADDGSFAIDAQDAPALDLRADDPEQRFAALEKLDVAAGARDVELVLGEPRWLTLRLCDPEGAPISWGHITDVSDDGAWIPNLDLGRAGSVRIPCPGRPLALDASAPGWRTRRFGPFEPAALGEELVLTLETGPSARGHVSFAGRPVAGARIDLTSSSPPGTVARSRGLVSLEHPFLLRGQVNLEESDGTTDEDGAFRIAVHQDGWQSLRVTAEGLPEQVFGPYELSRESGIDGLELELATAGALEGRVRLAPTAPERERLVAVSSGWNFAETTKVERDGSYRLEGLAPGDYQVRIAEPPAARLQSLDFESFRIKTEEPLVWDCGVRAGETTHYDLDLTQEESCVLLGHFALGSETPQLWSALLWLVQTETPEMRASCRLDAHGDFRLAVSKAGTYRLELYEERRKLQVELLLIEGETRWSFESPTALLRLTAPGVEFQGKAGVRFVEELPQGARFEADFSFRLGASVRVPAGHGWIEIRSLRSRNEPWKPHIEIELAPDEERRLEISLEGL